MDCCGAAPEVEAVAPGNGQRTAWGASMGGLCARYALAYMETHGLVDISRDMTRYDARRLRTLIERRLSSLGLIGG